MTTELFVFSLKALMILERKMRKKRGVPCINRAEETEGTREWDSHKLQI